MNCIYIIGHPGAGKALIAKKVADQLGWNFIDADFGLEFRIGKTLPEILGQDGYEQFLSYQLNLLSSVLYQKNSVITTDSSIVCRDENRKFLSHEFVVNLQVSTDTQTIRVSRQSIPLTQPNLKKFFDQLHKERDHFYEEVATINIDSDHDTVEEHISTIIDSFKKIHAIQKMSDPLALEQKDLILFHKITHDPVHLSRQHALCVKLLAQGKSSKEIAREINISYRTVEGYLAQAMDKLGCTSSKELIALYHHKP